MFRWRQHPGLLRLMAVVLAVLAVLGVQRFAPLAVQGIEEAAGDLTWRAAARSEPERRFVVVDIDEASLRDIGPWPWSRATMAELSQRLEQAGAIVQAYDITFSDPREGDDLLEQAWRASPVVAAQLFSLDARVTPKAGSIGPGIWGQACPATAPKAQGHYGNAASLMRSASALGHITPRVETDGVVRKVPALICHEGQAHPSLTLAAFWLAAQPEAKPGLGVQDWVTTQRVDQGLAGWMGPAAWLTSRSLPGLVVPLDVRGDLRVPYRLDRKAFASVSAADVLRGRGDLSVLKGTVALVGATAFGIGDTVATPQASVASGIEVHVQLLAALLDHRLPYTPVPAPALEWFVMALLAAALLLLARRQRGVPAKRLPLAGLMLAAGCWALASLALVQADLWLPWASAALFAIVLSVALATVEHALTRAQRERLSAHLGAYLPAPVAQRLMASDPTGSLQVDQREISVLCADIRNFSAFAAHRPPQETAALLHAFTCLAVDVVEQHGGVVENVVGDAVLATWNGYTPCPDHAQQALAAARELFQVTRPLLATGQPTPESSAVQPLALGVGLETGTAIVGSFGPARRRAHAALGEPVSVASRIQQMTVDLSVPILLGPEMASRLPSEQSESLGEYLLEGLSKHYTLHAPAGWAELVPTDLAWAASADQSDRDEPASWPSWVDDRGATGASRISGPAALRDA